MRDLESRERNALEEMLRTAELSFATVWCYPSCRIPIHILANADLQSTGGAAPETQRIKRGLKRRTTCVGFGNIRSWGRMNSYEHGFAPREGRGEPPKTAVPWVISVCAAGACMQSWRWRGLRLAMVQSHEGQLWCTAPLTGAASWVMELQPHRG